MTEIDVAADWEQVRAKFLFRKLQLPPPVDTGTVTAFRDGEVTLRENRRAEGYTFATKEIGYQGVRPGDLVIHAMDAFAGAIGVSDSYGKCSPVYSVCEPRRELDVRYYAYLLRDFALSGRIASLTQGIRERSTDFRFNIFGELRVPYFDVEHQRAIASFLDGETARIDTLIEKKRQLLDLLEEKRTALITGAVNGRLDPEAPVKDSGVEWIGEVPEHWEVSHLGALFRVTGGYAYKSSDFGKQGIPVIRMSNLKSGDLNLEDVARIDPSQVQPSYALRAGDLLMGMSGSLSNYAWVTEGDIPCQLNQRVGRIRPRSGIGHPRYAMFLLQSTSVKHQVDLVAAGTAQRNISAWQVEHLRIPIPPISEQAAVAKALDEAQTEIQFTVRSVKTGIAHLQEYRTALVSAAVTGKIDVREKVPV